MPVPPEHYKMASSSTTCSQTIALSEGKARSIMGVLATTNGNHCFEQENLCRSRKQTRGSSTRTRMMQDSLVTRHRAHSSFQSLSIFGRQQSFRLTSPNSLASGNRRKLRVSIRLLVVFFGTFLVEGYTQLVKVSD